MQLGIAEKKEAAVKFGGELAATQDGCLLNSFTIHSRCEYSIVQYRYDL